MIRPLSAIGLRGPAPWPRSEFVSTEHLFLALAKKGGPEVQGLLAARNVRPERVEAAMAEVRKGKKVTSADPEATFEALKKYARDLTEEVFGPVLHAVRWRANSLDDLLDDIAGNGYGLTLGIHSRIDGGVHGDIATASMAVNSIPAVIASAPGFRTMRDMKLPSYYGGR